MGMTSRPTVATWNITHTCKTARGSPPPPQWSRPFVPRDNNNDVRGDPRRQQQQQRRRQTTPKGTIEDERMAPIIEDFPLPSYEEEETPPQQQPLPFWQSSPQTQPPPPVQKQQQQQHPLQRPLSSTAQQRIPIHYQFRSKTASASSSNSAFDKDLDYFPFATDDNNNNNDAMNMEGDDDGPSFASARQDAVTSFLSSTPMGRYKLMLSSGLVGAALGTFVGKSLFSSRSIIERCILLWTIVFLVCTLLRNPYGELVRALGLALIYTWQETKTIRQRYPIGWQRLKPALVLFKSAAQEQQSPRKPFPSRPQDFSRIYALLVMALIGSICGSHVPIIPSWLGAMISAVGLAFSTTLPDARGDLARIVAMRVVALTRELWQIQQELEIVPKVGVVSGLILDKIMILDRQHRIKEKVGAILTVVYTQLARALQQQQQQGRNDGPEPFVYGNRNPNGPPPRTEQDGWRRPPMDFGGGDRRRPGWVQQQQQRPGPQVEEEQQQEPWARPQPPPPQQRGNPKRF